MKKALKDILFTQGFGTRYDCEQLAMSGAVEIEGVPQTDADAVYETDGLWLTWRDRSWPARDTIIIAMNKPAGYECSMKPGFNPSVMSLLPSPLRKRNAQPVGRLDVDTTGLLLFTDDGALLHRLTHPKRHVDKVYKVTCKHEVAPGTCEKLLAGVLLADEKQTVKAKTVEQVDANTLLLTLTEGKYHQVKRMVAACSNRVEALHRVSVGNYVMPDTLKEGDWVWIERSDIL